jgi:hypothetical protein
VSSAHLVDLCQQSMWHIFIFIFQI